MLTLDLLRHAPVAGVRGPLGRRDADADGAQLARLRDLMLGWEQAGRGPVPLAGYDRIVHSPARRCVQTLAALAPCPTTPRDAEPALWEQDFGAWEGRDFAALPDLGRLDLDDLAAHCPPGGESFNDLCARVWPVLGRLSGRVLVVAHAGTVRAALARVVGAAALSFAVAPLSISRMIRTEGGDWAVDHVNRRPFMVAEGGSGTAGLPDPEKAGGMA